MAVFQTQTEEPFVRPNFLESSRQAATAQGRPSVTPLYPQVLKIVPPSVAIGDDLHHAPGIAQFVSCEQEPVPVVVPENRVCMVQRQARYRKPAIDLLL